MTVSPQPPSDRASRTDDQIQPNYELYSGLRELAWRGTWHALTLLMRRASRDIAIVAAIVALCVIAVRSLNAGQAMTSLGFAAAMLIAAMLTGIIVLCLVFERRQHASNPAKGPYQAPEPRTE